MFVPRRLVAGLVAVALAVPPALAQPLPDLGGVPDAALTPQLERRIGESIVRDIRYRDTSYVDDPELSEYLATLGARLSQSTPGVRHDFEFFVMRDHTVNAFALPGGFVGVHTGLLQAAETESEVAAVIAHEIAHVTQRHIARLLGQQQQMQLPILVALAAAVLLARSRPDLATGATVAAQGAAVQSQLSYTRDFEREADRVGMQALEGAGFDPRAMATFFEKLQRSNRVADDGTVPGYLRTHPLGTERIADAQSRAAAMPYRQHPDSLEFHLVRAKLRAESGDAREAIAYFEAALRDKRYSSEAAARYGLAAALLRARRAKEAEAALAAVRAAGGKGPMVDILAGRARHALGDARGAAKLLAASRQAHPYSRAVLYAYVGALQDAGRNDDALAVLAEPLRQYPRDARLHALRSKTYATLGKRASQHQAQAEVYALQGSLPAAIEQLQLARNAGDGDFYQLSVVDARLKELRAQHAEELREARR